MAHPRPATASVRIIGGKFNGIRIRAVGGGQLRPSGDRLRESLFNCLGQRLNRLDCLDLFAGTGVLGFSAASLGARSVVFVEKKRQTANDIRVHIDRLNVSATVAVTDAEKFLTAGDELFDVVFLDPPFPAYRADADWQRLLTKVKARLRARARVYCESDRPLPPVDGWQVLVARRTGQVFWQILTPATVMAV